MTTSAAVDPLVDQIWDALLPPPAPGIWQWCVDRLRMPEGGRFSARRGRIFRRPLEVAGARLTGRPLVSDPYAHQVEEVYVVAAAALAKSASFLHPAILYAMAHTPRRIGLYMRRGKDLRTTRSGKLESQIEGTPELRDLLPRSEALRERAMGSDLAMVGRSRLYYRAADVLDDWRTEHFSLLAMDEFSRYSLMVAGLGDPMVLARGRQRPYPRTRLRLGATTPLSEECHGWRKLCAGDHERLMVACRRCGGCDWLNWRQVVAARPNGTGYEELDQVDPEQIRKRRLARWRCRWCDRLHNAAEVLAIWLSAEEAGRWVPGVYRRDEDHPEGHWSPRAAIDGCGRLGEIDYPRTPIRSYQAGALYSEIEALDEFAYQTARDYHHGRERAKRTTANDTFAEPFVAQRIQLSTADVLSTSQPDQPYRMGSCPVAAEYIWIILDQQGNTRREYWWPYIVRAYAPGASWLLDTGVCRSWGAIEQLEDRHWVCAGMMSSSTLTVMDSGNGNARADIYAWAARAPRRRMLVRGDPFLSPGTLFEEVTTSGSRRRRLTKPSRVSEFRIDAHHYRTIASERMGHDADAAEWYLPEDAPPRYLRSLTSEEQVEKRVRSGRGYELRTVWEPAVIEVTDHGPVHRSDTHWFAAEAYGCAVEEIMGVTPKPAPRDPPPRRAARTPSAADDYTGGAGDDWLGDMGGW